MEEGAQIPSGNTTPQGQPSVVAQQPVTQAPAQPSATNTKRFSGRLNRINYFVGITLVTVGFFSFFALTLFSSFYTYIPGVIRFVLQLSMLVLFILYTVNLGHRRIHDIGLSGWYMLIILAPPLYVFFSLFLLFQRGTPGDNIYGSEQKGFDLKKIFLG